MEKIIINEFTFETPDGCRYACKQAFTQNHVFIHETIRQIG